MTLCPRSSPNGTWASRQRRVCRNIRWEGSNEKARTGCGCRVNLPFLTLSRAGGGTETQGLFYLKVPIGATSKQDSTPVFGFMIRSNPDTPLVQSNPFRQLPIVDVRFGGNGHRSFHILGLETYRLNANGDAASTSGPPAEINWWIAGPVLGAAVLLIANEERKAKKKQSQCGLVAVFIPPPGPGAIQVCR